MEIQIRDKFYEKEKRGKVKRREKIKRKKNDLSVNGTVKRGTKRENLKEGKDHKEER